MTKYRFFGLALLVSLAVVVGGLVLVKPVWADCDEPGQHDGCGDGWCTCCTGPPEDGGPEETNCECVGPCTLGIECSKAHGRCKSKGWCDEKYTGVPVCNGMAVYYPYEQVDRNGFNNGGEFGDFGLTGCNWVKALADGTLFTETASVTNDLDNWWIGYCGDEKMTNPMTQCSWEVEPGSRAHRMYDHHVSWSSYGGFKNGGVNTGTRMNSPSRYIGLDKDDSWCGRNNFTVYRSGAVMSFWGDHVNQGFGPFEGWGLLTGFDEFEKNSQCPGSCMTGRARFGIYHEFTGLAVGAQYQVSVMSHGGRTHSGKDGGSGILFVGPMDGDVYLKKGGADEAWEEKTINFNAPSSGSVKVFLTQPDSGEGDSQADLTFVGGFDDLIISRVGPEITTVCPTAGAADNTVLVGVSVAAGDDCGVETYYKDGSWAGTKRSVEMRFSDDGGTTWGDWMMYRSAVLPYRLNLNTGTITVQIKNVVGNVSTANCQFSCPSPAATVTGYVWEDVNADGFSVGESPSDKAKLYWDDWGGALITPVTGFNLTDVVPGNHKIYLDPNDCYCGTKWNNGSSADDYSTVFGETNKYAPINNVLAGETRRVYLGIQKAGFSVDLPVGPLTIDPAHEDELKREFQVTVSNNGCWNPADATVGLTATIDKSGVTASIDQISVNPVGGSATATVTLTVLPQSDYDNPYTLTVTGTGSSACLGATADTLEINVEHVGWWQSRAGDIYGRGGITSYIPSDSAAFRSGFPSGDYLSLDNSDPGVVLSGGSTDSIELGLGGVSSENWKAESYHLGFFQSASGQFDYDFDYFQANLDASADCTLSSNGVLVDDHVCTGSVGVCDGAQTIVVSDCPVIKIEGNLDVDTPNLDGVRAVFLVSGNQLHFHADFAPEGYFAFIVNGNIAISTVVNNVRAILLASHTITDYIPWDEKAINWEDLPNGLLIRGEAIALGGFSLNRTRLGADGDVDSADDDLEAANFFDFDGALFLELQDLLGTPQYSWQELP